MAVDGLDPGLAGSPRALPADDGEVGAARGGARWENRRG